MTAPLIAIPTYHLGPGRVGNWEGAYALLTKEDRALGHRPADLSRALASIRRA